MEMKTDLAANATQTTDRPADPGPSLAPGPETDVLTAAELAQVLRDSLRQVAVAAAVYAEAEAHRADLGNPRREPLAAVRHARLAAAAPDLEAAAIAADAAGRAADSNARRALAQLAGDRIALPPAAMPAAAALAPLIERDAERLPLRHVAAEVRAAVVAGDPAAQYCWHRALGPRLGVRPAGVEHPDDARARAELGRLRGQIGDRLRDATNDPLRAAAAELLERAGTTRAAAGRGRQSLAGPVKTMSGATKVPWPES